MKAYFDAYSDNYKDILAKSTGEDIESASFFADQKVNHLCRSLKNPSNIKSILDYGCGVGMSLRPLQLAFPQAKIIGVDPSTRSLEVAAREHSDCNVSMIHLDQLKHTELEKSFDLIFISCVFHHIDAEEHVIILKKLMSLCKPNGQLAIFEHNPVNPVTRKIVRDCPFDEGVTLISPRRLRHRLTAAGWEGLRKRYISFVPPKLKRLKLLERFLSWCPLGGQYFVTAQPGHGSDVAS